MEGRGGALTRFSLRRVDGRQEPGRGCTRHSKYLHSRCRSSIECRLLELGIEGLLCVGHSCATERGARRDRNHVKNPFYLVVPVRVKRAGILFGTLFNFRGSFLKLSS